ncbi:hypothetical protein P153DRAFT_111062 [Dothidotthia symphoricarpi CBS 119687]|uniref:Uncharacterized protein n=1 Tax=Dothidotthia symphoricarpi CBS 119687 TaxID=1392245 RepID=A0A6A5ZZW2_9PLEO|nr:uncharacterized protein P153DRAFT_111062 [Dothidotthia symphoricarpi CBS 119687]KAF2125292.1 hypothetical protein P153DRAFT_111062 [Dothidotthia symphoricarpi CBS 119687]
MVLKLRRLFHVDAGITGHAHPLHQAIHPDAQCLHDVVANIPFDIQLYGLSDEGDSQVTDIYCPRVRRSALTNSVTSHLDVVSCWKGLSRSQAVELVTWEHLFKTCLEDAIQLALRDIFVQYLGRQRYTTDETLLLPRFLQFLSHRNVHLIDINITNLIHAMIRMSCEDYLNPVETMTHLFPWSLSQGDLPKFLYNLLQTRDCFFNSASGSCVFVELSYTYIDDTLTILANVDWRSTNIDFPNLPVRLSSGALYCIAPRSLESRLGSSVSSTFALYDSSSHFALSQPQLPFYWDEEKECFKTKLPLDTKKNINFPMETIVIAEYSTLFPDNVRFERTSRYSVKLEICDDSDSKASAGGHRRDSVVDIRVDNINSDVQDAICCKSDLTRNHPTVFSGTREPWIPSYTSTPLSKLRSPLESSDCGDDFSIDVPRGLGRHDSFFSGDDEIECDSMIKRDPRRRFSAFMDTRPVLKSTTETEEQAATNCVIAFSPDKIDQLYMDVSDHEKSHNMKHPLEHRSSQKRKVSKYVDRSLDTVRQAAINQSEQQYNESENKRQRLLHGDSVAYMDTRLVRAISTGTLWNDWRAPMNDLLPPAISSTTQSYEPRQGQVEAGMHPLLHWHEPNTAYGLPSPCDSDSSYGYGSPPPLTAASGSGHSRVDTELSQEQIQHNYHEFERMATEKRCHAPDEECKAFEDIFLDDSGVEDWSYDLSGLSDVFEDVNMEE